MVCPRCNNMLPNGSVACNKCGYLFNVPMNQQPQQYQQTGPLQQPQQYQQTGPLQQPQINQQPQQMQYNNPNWNKPVKQSSKASNFAAIAIVGIIILWLFGTIISAARKSNNSNNNSSKVETTTEALTESKGDSKSDSQESGTVELPKVDLSEYNYINPQDLAKYAPNLGDQKVYFEAVVSSVTSDKIQVNLGDGYMLSNCNTKEDYTSLVEKDDSVIICGKVNKLDSYGFLGNSVDLSDCYVADVNYNSSDYELASSSDALIEYFYVTDEIVSVTEVSKEEYKSVCQTYNYEDILRNEDDYKGKHAELSGRVDQIIEGLLNSYTIYIKDGNGNKWECSYTYKDGESKLLEGDSVTVYGEIGGTRNSTTVLGKQVTMPYIKIEYHE